MSDPKLVMLDLSALTTATEVIESSLIAYGIQVVRIEVGGHSVYPTGPMNWVDLYVPEENLAEAQEVLEKLAQMEHLAEEENPPRPPDDDSRDSEFQG